MQSESHSHEQNSVDEETIQNQFLSLQSPIEHENTLPKSNRNRRLSSLKSNYRNVLTDIKRHDALSSVPFELCDNLLDLRLHRKNSKIASQHNEQSLVITINVSGARYQTYLSTLQLYPDTLLGNENKRKDYWDPNTEEYFFDRHRACFEAILYYYQSHGRLRRPDFVPLDTFLEEIDFFELGSEASTHVHKSENIKKVEQIQMPRMLWRRCIWFFFEFPQHSIPARIINLISMFFTILSCVSIAIESLPIYTDRWDDICKEAANISLNSTFVPRCSALFTSPFFIIETICVIFFTIEFFLRFISTPSYFRFALSFYNWVDLCSIVPYYVILSIQLANQDFGLDTSAVLILRLLRVLRVLRIFNIYHTFRRLKSLRILGATVKESLIDFAVMATLLTLLAFLFGAATYYAEKEINGNTFDSIPKATYWGIITITGIGYGDMYPISPVGRILTCLCALSGPATIGMLVSVLVDRYQRVYNRKMYISQSKIPSANFGIISNEDDHRRSVFSLQKSSRIKDISAALFKRVSSFQGRIKHEQHQPSSQSCKLQFVVSFNGNNHDSSEVDNIVTVMKKKLAETVSNTDIDINLKLLDNESKELWTISSPVASSNLTTLKNILTEQSSRIDFF